MVRRPRVLDNSTGRLALIGGAVLLVVVIIGLVLLAIREGESDSPRATSESFVAAVDDQDCEAIKRLVTKDYEPARS
jgi:uncharacterized membrane protein